MLREELNYTPNELGFGTSGLRGLITDMTDLECYINTVGFLKFLEQDENLKLGATVSVGGDLRASTPRILQAVSTAIVDSGYEVEYCGLIPTPALAFWALNYNRPCIMVTGSHIPDDRNGIKFYKQSGEVLKTDEVEIKAAVSAARDQAYNSDDARFNNDGSLVKLSELQTPAPQSTSFYLSRFLDVFETDFLSGKHIVVYQHSAVGRDILVELLEKLGAKVTSVGRSEKFIPIDTENVTPDDQAYFLSLAQKFPDAFAIVSTDGDSDRPFLIDEHGEFHRGDVLGFIGAQELEADFAAIPVSSSDAVDLSLDTANIAWQHTKIGSPHVIVVMEEALKTGRKKAVGWEVNGGFLTATDISYRKGMLRALATRDAFLPILLALSAALKKSLSISELFAQLPERFTQAGLIDNFPQEDSNKIVTILSKKDDESKRLINEVFTSNDRFGSVVEINTTDGIRITFDSDEIAHIRPSGNAPQLRIYSVAPTQDRADEIVALSISKPAGILRRLQKLV